MKSEAIGEILDVKFPKVEAVEGVELHRITWARFQVSNPKIKASDLSALISGMMKVPAPASPSGGSRPTRRARDGST